MIPTYPDRVAGILGDLGVSPDYGCIRGMPLQPEATELVVARVLSDGRELKLAPDTAIAWEAMRTAAGLDQVTLLLISGFRSVDYQRQILERKIAGGQSLDEILRVNAAPGFSEHHTGRAVDIGTPGSTPLEEAFEQTDAFRWLGCHAARFGFQLSYPRTNTQGIIYEPWHWFHRTPSAVETGC